MEHQLNTAMMKIKLHTTTCQNGQFRKKDII
jgi:hypothetical protein